MGRVSETWGQWRGTVHQSDTMLKIFLISADRSTKCRGFGGIFGEWRCLMLKLSEWVHRNSKDVLCVLLQVHANIRLSFYIRFQTKMHQFRASSIYMKPSEECKQGWLSYISIRHDNIDWISTILPHTILTPPNAISLIRPQHWKVNVRSSIFPYWNVL